MARKIIDIQPVITGRLIGGVIVTTEAEARAQVEDALALLGDDFECMVAFETDDRCEFCNAAWTEASADYNAGCCARDEANDPERLKEMAETAEAISGETFYRYDPDRGRCRGPVNWPDQFGAAVATWLERGRPADSVATLLRAAAHVEESDWCTVWEDPGPSGCSLARRADEVTVDGRPEGLAADLRRLLDDMGVVPAKVAA